MTTAPANLMAVRSLLLEHLDIAPGAPSADLTPAEVGIVGDPAHRGGYHCGSDRVDADDYSVDESPRDRSGLTLNASALDVGWFEVRSRGAVHNLRTFSIWCVGQCKAGAKDCEAIREVIYSPDGRVVRRWDRLGKSTAGDSSHLMHTHVSYYRDATRDGRDLTGPYRRYLQEIGLITPPKPAAPVRRHIITAAEGTGMPHLMIKHASHNEVFALFGSGLVRHIGPTELAQYQELLIPLEQTSDEAEYQRLLKTAQAVQA